jgi:uncharacterized membrane protein YdbT with pleckstrin-like domain
MTSPVDPKMSPQIAPQRTNPQQATPAQAPPASAVVSGPHAEPADTEDFYWLGGLILIALAGWLAYKQIGPWWLKVGLIVVALVAWCIPWLESRSIRYRISNYRIDYERGLIAKNIDTLELWHVEDLHFHQSLLDRVMDLGTITVTSKDEAMPKLELFGIPNPRPIYELLKQRVIAVKRQRGVMKIDPG